MRFDKIIKGLSTQKEIPLSRLYGYTRSKYGSIIPVESEASIIEKVIKEIASTNIIEASNKISDLVKQLNDDGHRTRSGKRWTRSMIIGLVRPIYAGIAVSPLGIWRKSKFYSAIVTVDMIKKALKVLKDAKLDQ